MILSSTDSLNGLSEKFSQAFAKKEAMQDVVYGVENPRDDNFPELLARSEVVDRFDHLGRWRDQGFHVDLRSGRRGYADQSSYFLFPLLIIEEISYHELLRILPLRSPHYATVRELLSFVIVYKKLVQRLVIRQRYRIFALGRDDFDRSGIQPAFLKSAHSLLALDRSKDAKDERWGPKDVFLFRYPSCA